MIRLFKRDCFEVMKTIETIGHKRKLKQIILNSTLVSVRACMNILKYNIADI
jgi:hypothetical protein